jgi:hypothetical protein
MELNSNTVYHTSFCPTDFRHCPVRRQDDTTAERLLKRQGDFNASDLHSPDSSKLLFVENAKGQDT